MYFWVEYFDILKYFDVTEMFYGNYDCVDIFCSIKKAILQNNYLAMLHVDFFFWEHLLNNFSICRFNTDLAVV